MRGKVDALIEYLGILAMTAMVLACIWQVFSRYVLASPSGFTEEFMRFALIWTSMIGAPYAFGKGKHLAIVFGVNQLSPAGKLKARYVVDLCVLFFAVVVLIAGGLFVSHNAIGQVSAALGMPMQYLYLILPVSGVLFIFYLVFDFRQIKIDRAKLAAA